MGGRERGGREGVREREGRKGRCEGERGEGGKVGGRQLKRNCIIIICANNT